MKPVFITALGERITSPIVVKTQDRPNAKTMTSSIAASTPATPAAGSEAQDEAESDDDRRGDREAHAVADHGADERRRPPDRQRAEAVDDALRHVGVERDAGVDAR